ncbi:MAG: hypothetical protein E7253_11000 [Lachnospiraceae bacterium]|nr:hypothetical protein [Lachnospiraceae bacterium]
MEIRKTQVFAGDRHSGLILNKDGDLYVFGENFRGRFDRRLPELIPFVKPVLLARNVKHAALGGTAVIYVTKSGEVCMVGESDYVKRFPGFTGASKVYAVPADIYWIETEDGKVYAFGQNNRQPPMDPDFRYDSRITPKEEKEVIRWEVVKQEFECEINNYDARDVVDSDLRHTAHNYVRDQEFYKELVKQHTADNVIVYVDRCKDELLSARYENKLFGKKIIENRRWTYEAWVTVVNNSVYEPVLCENEELDKWKASSKPEHSLSDTTDVSVWADTALIVKRTGEVLLGIGNTKKILAGKGAKSFTVNRTVGKEWTEPFVKVCAGSREAILLNKSGKLYTLGYGAKDADLVGTKIKDGAIGYRDILSITETGDARFIRRDDVDSVWAEAFQGFSNAVSVYAKDSLFVIRDKDEQYHAFGYNGQSGLICSYVNEQIYDFGEQIVEVEHKPVYKTTPPYTGVSVPEDNGQEQEQLLKFHFMNMDIYRDFLKQYGEDNVRLVMEKVKSEETQYKGWSDYVELITYHVFVERSNSSIFQPVPYEGKKVKNAVNYFSQQNKEQEWKDVTLHPIKKAFRVLASHWIFLCEDGSLILWNEKDGQSRYLITDIIDMDMNDHFILSEKSCSVIMGTKEVFHQLAKDDQLELETIIADPHSDNARRLTQ